VCCTTGRQQVAFGRFSAAARSPTSLPQR
jgi:hypothetical protein